MAKRVVLNLQQMRADEAIPVNVVTDFNGVEHEIQSVELDGILEIMQIENEFEDMQAQEASGVVDRKREITMLMRLRDLIAVVLPTFPVGGLRLRELMMVAQALQVAVQPDNPDEDADGEDTGESTSPG